jgi:signal peptidase I
MPFKEKIQRFWHFLNEDTWQAWVVSCILIIALIKLVIFPLLAILTGTPLPIVVVESCSMHHTGAYENWWGANKAWYEEHGITKEQFNTFAFKNGFTKGDIIFVLSPEHTTIGEVLIFAAPTQYPIIHRVIAEDPLATKGDNNPSQLSFEKDISPEKKIGKAVFKIPLLGWIKLIFFEPLRHISVRGFCD